MDMIAFVGHSGSGKTRLISSLVPELKKRGLTVAVIKHCHHGFDLGGERKDSSKFLAAGALGVLLAAPGRVAVLQNTDCETDLAALARRHFSDADIVLVEGGKSAAGLRKIEVLRRGLPDRLPIPRQELAAVISDIEAIDDLPLFHPDQAEEIATWLTEFFHTKSAKGAEA